MRRAAASMAVQNAAASSAGSRISRLAIPSGSGHGADTNRPARAFWCRSAALAGSAARTALRAAPRSWVAVCRCARSSSVPSTWRRRPGVCASGRVCSAITLARYPSIRPVFSSASVDGRSCTSSQAVATRASAAAGDSRSSAETTDAAPRTPWRASANPCSAQPANIGRPASSAIAVIWAASVRAFIRSVAAISSTRSRSNWTASSGPSVPASGSAAAAPSAARSTAISCVTCSATSTPRGRSARAANGTRTTGRPAGGDCSSSCSNMGSILWPRSDTPTGHPQATSTPSTAV